MHSDETHPTDPDPSPVLPAHRIWIVALWSLGLAGVLLVGTAAFSFQRHQARKAAQEQLAIVSSLKVRQVLSWIGREQAMAESLARGMLVSETLDSWLRGGPLPEATRARIAGQLLEVQMANGYQDVCVLSVAGEPLVSGSGRLIAVDRRDKWVLADALLTARSQMTSIRKDGDDLGGVHLDILAPLVVRTEGQGRVLAILRVRLDPRSHLFPLVQEWPGPTETSETILTEIQGADVVVLSEPRRMKWAALQLVFPINQASRLVAQVAQGRVDQSLEGLDYLQQPVLGIGRAIPGTQWQVVATESLREISRDVWSRSLLTSLVALALVGAAALSIRSWAKQKLDAQIQIELENQANTDRLTGLANRRRLESHASQELRRILRHQRQSPQRGNLAVVLVDVDHFKLFNDTYGHLAGDACLKAVASVIPPCAHRPGDLACRYGGEEFVLVLPDTAEEGALVVAEIVRQAIQGLGIPHASSPVADVVTASLGVASAEVVAGFNLDALLERADQSLYLAKHSGRNRVVGSSSLV